MAGPESAQHRFYQRPADEGGQTNPGWKDWYPPVKPDFSRIPLGESAYGEPNEETLQLFAALHPRSNILDAGVGDGRYALRLAIMGHNITGIDVDQQHLNRLQNNATQFLSESTGTITPMIADATQRLPFAQQFDAVLSTGFAYLIPPDELDRVFQNITEVVKPNGLVVVEFATNRDRRDAMGNSLIGSDEYNYGYEEGTTTLQRLYNKYDIDLKPLQTKTIHLEGQYSFHNDLIIAHGIKR
jgi:SAM-dependent methyltransferase